MTSRRSARPPSVDSLARSLAGTGLPHPLLVRAAREAIAADDVGSASAIAEATRRTLLQPVVNATGVLLHTNLGRSPITSSVEGTAYSNLELDLETGKRGSRQNGAGPLLAEACGAEAALVVNNCAAAVVLVLATLAAGKGVAVSRGELVEIGGGFRIPEVLASSGARLVEVGTTNRTRLADYRGAADGDDASPGVAALMKVHTSNYRITGFTEEVGVRALATLGLPVVVDLGSGLLDAATPWLPDGPPAWLDGEPGTRQVLADGADLVTFSGDKLLGGPQAGIIAGRADLVRACARHPLARALRPGGLVLAALQSTALAYLRRDAQAIPFWRMASAPLDELRRRAQIVSANARWSVVDCGAVTGGGTLPGVEIPSVGVAAAGDHRDHLRRAEPPILARVFEGDTICDLRTVDPTHDEHLARMLGSAPAGGH